MTPAAAGVFVHECFGHKSEADFMLGDEHARREWALGPFDREKLRQRAIEALDLKMEYPFEPAADKEMRLEKTSALRDERQLLDETRRVLDELECSHREFRFSNSVSFTRIEARLHNERGLDLVDVSETSISHCSSTNPLVYFARHLDGKNFAAGATPLASLQGPLASDFHHDMSATPLASLQGQRRFSEKFTLYQSSHVDDCFDCFFDSEGTVNEGQRFALVENGVIKTPYTDRRTASRHGLPLTGAAAKTYDSIPALACPYLAPARTENTLRKLTGKDSEVLALTASGGDSIGEGDFATPFQLAFLYRDGYPSHGRAGGRSAEWRTLPRELGSVRGPLSYEPDCERNSATIRIFADEIAWLRVITSKM